MPDLTVSADIDSFMQSANKAAAVSFLGALTTTQIAGLSTTAPAALATAPVVGLSTFAARGDHQHIFPTAAQVGALGATAAAGGDLTGNYPNPTLAAITTAQAGVGSSTQIPVLSIDAKGRVTALTSVAASGGTATPTDVQVFTSSGTWTKPAGARSVHVQCIGGGGGGGSGRASLSGSAAGGGGGGGSAARSFMFLDATLLGSTETVTVGAFGSGGAGVAPGGAGQNGVAGGGGTASSFGASPVWVYAGQGGGGAAGTSATGGVGGSAASRGLQAGFNGGAASATFAAGATGGSGTGGAPASGGGGGGINAAGTIANAGTGGFQFVINGATAVSTPVNTAGFSVPANSPYGGSGGGGGTGSTTANASNGGAGGNYGAGGGGGGPAVSFNSGSGGDGAPGIIVVTTFF